MSGHTDVAEVALPALGAAAGGELTGDLAFPPDAAGLVIFAHGSGSSRHSPRNVHVAEQLRRSGYATLLMDLLTPHEEREDVETARLRFEIELLTQRVLGVLDWVRQRPDLRGLPAGLFGASTGAAAALGAAAYRPREVGAVVSRGGRPDLSAVSLATVRVPTLLIVGDRDTEVLLLNERAASEMGAENEVHRVAGAGHLFTESGALEEVTAAAVAWFDRFLK